MRLAAAREFNIATVLAPIGMVDRAAMMGNLAVIRGSTERAPTRASHALVAIR